MKNFLFLSSMLIFSHLWGQETAWWDAYFRNIHTLQCRFTETIDDQPIKKGTLYLSRQHQCMHIQYDDTRYKILLYPECIVFYQENHVSYIDIKHPLHFWLKNENISSYYLITPIVHTRYSSPFLQCHPIQSNGHKMSLLFTNPPYRLIKWSFVDPTSGRKVSITLENMIINQKIDPKIFQQHDPRFSGDIDA